jgi:hypothetical protein
MSNEQIHAKFASDLERLKETGFRDQARRNLESLMDQFGGEEVLHGIKSLRECFEEESNR